MLMTKVGWRMRFPRLALRGERIARGQRTTWWNFCKKTQILRNTRYGSLKICWTNSMHGLSRMFPRIRMPSRAPYSRNFQASCLLKISTCLQECQIKLPRRELRSNFLCYLGAMNSIISTRDFHASTKIS